MRALAALLIIAGCSSGSTPRALDGSPGPDPDSASSDCPSGMHLCSGACVSNGSLATCGASCVPCTAPPGGTATCDGTSCGATCPTAKKLCGGACIDERESCGGSCPPGTHDCAGSCLPDTAPTSCGRSCMPCTTPANGTATCVNGVCGVTCQSGYHRCGLTCVSNTDPETCGTSCEPCPIPQNGIATCEGGKCGVACPGRLLCGDVCVEANRSCGGVCPAGKHDCSGRCVSDSEPASCGTSCKPCPIPANGSATCNGTACGVACAAGFHRCGLICASNTSTASCGPTSCAACPVPANGSATCDGTKCGVTCAAGLHACGTECVDSKSPAACGNRCMPCDAPANAHATCDGTACASACDAGTFVCTNMACGRTTWEFESGTVEGWHYFKPTLGVMPPRSSATFSHSGTRSLAIDINTTVGIAVTVYAPICPGLATSLTGKTVTAFVRFEGPTGGFSTVALANTSNPTDESGGFSGQVDNPRIGEWTKARGVFDDIAYQIGIYFDITFDNQLLPRWMGTLYIDSITIE